MLQRVVYISTQKFASIAYRKKSSCNLLFVNVYDAQTIFLINLEAVLSMSAL